MRNLRGYLMDNSFEGTCLLNCFNGLYVKPLSTLKCRAMQLLYFISPVSESVGKNGPYAGPLGKTEKCTTPSIAYFSGFACNVRINLSSAGGVFRVLRFPFPEPWQPCHAQRSGEFISFCPVPLRNCSNTR